MYAIIETGGKQYKLSPGDLVKLEKVKKEVGAKIDFPHVLLIADGERLEVGRPHIGKAKVVGEVVKQGKAEKVISFKYRRRKDSRRKVGHRQLFTEVRIEQIVEGGRYGTQDRTG